MRSASSISSPRATASSRVALFSSTRYYGVRLTNGTFGYVSETWIHPSHRGGLGLPAC